MKLYHDQLGFGEKCLTCLA